MKAIPTFLVAALACFYSLQAEAVTITTPPQAVGILQGDAAVFVVQATGTGVLSYQWKKNGSDIPGATNQSLVLNPTVAADAAAYSVAVSDTASSTATSSGAVLSFRTVVSGDIELSFSGGATINGSVIAVAVQSDGKVIIGGDFTAVNGAARGGIARLNVDGSTDYSFGNGQVGANNSTVNAVALQSDGKVIIGGLFTKVNGTTKGRIARLNSDGSLDTGFGNGLAGTNGFVNTVTLQSDGKVLIGGFFTTVNGVARGHIARLNSDGTLDTGFGNGLVGVNNQVTSIAQQSDGKVLVGGVFSTVNGTARTYIARLNSDGTLNTAFGSGLAGPNSYVNAVAVQSDGKVLIGGFFTSVNGAARGYTARLNNDGTLDTSFGNGLAGANDRVYAVALQSDGKVLIGGYFTKVNGTASNHVARINIDGTLDTGFGNGVAGANNSVFAVGLQSDGKALIGGFFTKVNGTSRGSIARLLNDGTLDTGFGDGLAGADYIVNAVALQSDGKVLLGGAFGAVNGTARSGVVRLHGSSPAQDIAVAQTSALTDGVSSVDFGSVTLGGNSAKTFTITNPGNGDLASLYLTQDGTNTGDFTVSALSGTSIPVGSGSVTFTATFNPSASGARSAAIHIASNVTGAKNPFDITLAGTGQTAFAAWAASKSVANDPNGLGSNGVKNLLNFAFNVNPTTGSSGALAYTGIFAGSGTIATTCQPLVMMDPATNGTEIRGLFVRQKDATSAGLTYMPQFSADLTTWQDSASTPIVLADDGVNQIVSVPYPPQVGGQQAKFFRINVSLAP